MVDDLLPAGVIEGIDEVLRRRRQIHIDEVVGQLRGADLPQGVDLRLEPDPLPRPPVARVPHAHRRASVVDADDVDTDAGEGQFLARLEIAPEDTRRRAVPTRLDELLGERAPATVVGAADAGQQQEQDRRGRAAAHRHHSAGNRSSARSWGTKPSLSRALLMSTHR